MNLQESRVRQFFREDGTLISIPARQAKKIELLQLLVQEFKSGDKYSEKEVNEILGRFHEDTAALRRYMIENRIMARNTESVYWLNSKQD